jgi:hypothetical protein
VSVFPELSPPVLVVLFSVISVTVGLSVSEFFLFFSGSWLEFVSSSSLSEIVTETVRIVMTTEVYGLTFNLPNLRNGFAQY